ncbi:MAG: Lrp/AsnC family transcriptional regulator [Candidatus Heimdallarchaeota archaeon]|nr:Lrp/AsnC family transcriptional regulator [Candidatus Heimdallarchaeota archaeon]MCK5049237.1 Lrp/AsnC family transcriptional regulator [Candidatus Heimdallarchaeota archaeon]
MKELDQIDIIILEALIDDSRTSPTNLAKKIGKSEATVRNRIKKLVDVGIIENFGLEINAKLIGYKIVAYVGADLADPESVSDTHRYLKKLLKKELKTNIRIPKIYLTHGDHDILIEIWAKDLDCFNDFISENIESNPNFSKICPAIIVEKL